MVKLWLSLLILVIVGQNILGIVIKDGTKKPQALHNLRHSILNKKHGHHKNSVKTRLETKRCTIFCPIVIIFPHSNVTSSLPKTTENRTASHRTSIKLAKKPPSSSRSSKKHLNQNGRSFKKIKKEERSHIAHKKHYKSELSRSKHKTERQTKNHKNRGNVTKHKDEKKRHLSREKRNAATKKKIIAKKYSYHELNSNQRQLVLKNLNFGNSQPKKAFEFRESSTSQCRVVCTEEYVEATTARQKVSTTESDDSEEDSFEEGEDVPVEATVKPAKPHSIVIGGIRPFGQVNFNGFDDFGPNGEPAKDIPLGENIRNQKKKNT